MKTRRPATLHVRDPAGLAVVDLSKANLAAATTDVATCQDRQNVRNDHRN